MSKIRFLSGLQNRNRNNFVHKYSTNFIYIFLNILEVQQARMLI